MQGTKSEIPDIHMDPLNNGQPSQNLTIPALFPAQGKVLNTIIQINSEYSVSQMVHQYFAGDKTSGLAGDSLASTSASNMM